MSQPTPSLPTPSSIDAQKRYEEMKRNPVALDITRGKPSAEQLDLSADLLTILGPGDYKSADGTDCRNYGGLDGLPEARSLFAEMLEVRPDQVLAGGNSSLSLMHDSLVHALLHGVPDGSGPWLSQRPRFLCPCPGYDRHFSMLQNFGIEMIAVPLTPTGPDMEMVERLVATDASIKGMWVLPRYANPTGLTYAPEVVSALARMKTAAPDFRILWDDAYAVHDLADTPDALANCLALGEAAGNGNRFLLYTSFSKITFAGAGVAAMAGSQANLDWMRKHTSMSTIGPDKLNQLRHVRFFENLDAIRDHMKKHAAILRPKFACVERVLSAALAAAGMTHVASWTRPRGGYFVSLDALPGRATQVVKMAADVGLKLTPAGSAFPYRKDPEDRNIRIAPSFPTLPELERAMDVLTVAIICASAGA
ncbi:MAG TPA: aminotransferase class I/II-fold pyridoxal phosphate-dependent enzyme [Haliangium sp.]|nr:aminotransferase class I/II-fold pyridoxal phosphate-dependent enzyme [Haliangium sp.]